MPIPIERKEASGALIVASGLALGGLLLLARGYLGLETPDLLLREHVSEQVRAVDVKPEGHGASQPSGIRLKADGDSAESTEAAGSTSHVTLDQRGKRLGPVDLNRATAAELEMLDGIGPALSLRIVELRAKKGGCFHSMDELLEVKGIGPATLNRIGSSAILGGAADRSQNSVLRKSTSTHVDSAASQR